MNPIDVLVTGAAGFLGRATTARLSADLNVVGCDIAASAPDLNVPYVQLDVRDADEIRATVRRLSPSAIVHLAAAMDVAGNDPTNLVETNIAGTTRVLDAAVLAGVRTFVYGSSVMVYGPRSDAAEHPTSEERPVDPRTLYGASKAFIEQLLEQEHYAARLRTVALRFTTIYGPGRLRRGAFPQVVDVFRAAASGTVADINPTQESDIIHVRDAAEAVWAALRCPTAAGPYNIGHQVVSGAGLLAAARAVRGDLEAREIDGPPSSWPAHLECGRAHHELGWRPHSSLEEGVHDAITWFERLAPTRHPSTQQR